MAPRTLPGSIALFSVGYLLWQPVALLLLSLVAGSPVPFRDSREWISFAAVCVSLGAVAGIAWFFGTRSRAEWLRAWTKSSVTMLAMAVTLSADALPNDSLLPWLLVVAFMATLTGALFTPLYYWSDRYEARHRPLIAPAAEPGAAADAGPDDGAS